MYACARVCLCVNSIRMCVSCVCSYRDLLESSLHSTGMTQCDVIAWLADQLLLQAVDSVVAEVQQLHDTVSQALLDAV